MDIEQLREYCIAKPATTEGFPFDGETLVFKVAGKMFAIIPLEKGDRISLKCDPDRAIELRAEWEEITAGWHLSKKHWNSLNLRGRLSSELVKELVDHSYELVKKGLTKKVREEHGF
jgi:predicted DNA-binding protein (MmcQ/YjbR family)